MVLLLQKPYINIGLGTYTFTVPSAGIYRISTQLTEVPPSGLSVVINNNGSPVYTAATLSPTQIAQQFYYSQLYAANDAISIVVSSSAGIDSMLNNVKYTLQIMQGY